MGRGSKNKVTSRVSYHNVSTKHLHLEVLSKAFIVKFEVEEDIISTAFLLAKDNKYPDYLETIYNYI